MKKILLVALIAFSTCAQAESYTLNFNGIPLVQFAQATYKAMLKRDYVISSELLAMDKPISVAVKNVDAAELPQLVDRVLSSQGVKSVERSGVYFLVPDDAVRGNGSERGVAVLPLSGAVAGTHDAGVDRRNGGGDDRRARLDGSVGDYVAPSWRVADEEREVFRPLNRKSDFIANVLNGAYQSKPAVSAAGVVVMTAPRAQLEKMLKLAASVDAVGHKVKLSATFVEVSTTESSGLGVSVIADVLGAKLGVKLGDSSTNSLSLKTNSFQAVIDALAADGRFKQIANPTAVVDDYEKGNLSFGDSVPTIASTTLDRNGNPIQQVAYQQSGVLLNVTPSVLGSGKINVVVDGQVSSFSTTTTGVAGSPTLSKRQVQTTVTMDDGELLLIGGLNNNKTVNNSSGFLFLPKSWATKSESSASTDLVLILSASVVK